MIPVLKVGDLVKNTLFHRKMIGIIVQRVDRHSFGVAWFGDRCYVSVWKAPYLIQAGQ